MSLKPLQYAVITTCVGWYVADISQRFRNEVHVCSLLHNEDAVQVPLVGVYSTEAHSFGLVYEYMDGLDLKQYLRNNPNVGRVKLVLIPIHTHSLLDINLLMVID